MPVQELQDAFVLHRRPYRDSSLLVDFFSRSQGRVRAVARGARQARGKRAPALQAFQPLLVELRGRSELQTLLQSEANGPALSLQAERLFSGLYLNELLTRLLTQAQAAPGLYDAYQSALQGLARGDALEPLLRHFEFLLLEELGYGLDLFHDAAQGEAIRADRHYYFQAGQGLLPAPPEPQDAPERSLYSGEQILAIRAFELQDPAVSRAAKQLFRAALRVQLGPRPLHSRRLFSRRNAD